MSSQSALAQSSTLLNIQSFVTGFQTPRLIDYSSLTVERPGIVDRVKLSDRLVSLPVGPASLLIGPRETDPRATLLSADLDLTVSHARFKTRLGKHGGAVDDVAVL